MSYQGIDVSSYQGKPDWTKVKQDGVKFAILRICNSKGVDSSFESNYSGCENAGIARGVYRYSYAKTVADAIKEAQEVVDTLAGRVLEIGVWLDLEWSTQRALGKSAVTAIAQAWLQIVNNAGYSCGIYCNLDWYKNVIETDKLQVPYWIARYSSSDDGTMKESLQPNVGETGWQYSSKGSVSGISGNVDMDVWYGDLSQIQTVIATRSIDTEAVSSLQEALNADGITDANGNALKVDGISGKNTAAAIQKVLLKSGAFDTSKGRYTVGSTGQVVKWMQMRLNTVIGDSIVELLGAGLDADGLLGAGTRLAIGLFQEIRGLDQDYIAGPITITELLYTA